MIKTQTAEPTSVYCDKVEIFIHVYKHVFSLVIFHQHNIIGMTRNYAKSRLS